jgi:GTP-binding protein EngB required for normal cell division
LKEQKQASFQSAQNMSDIQTIVLLGKVGHGKTTLINKICGSRYPAAMTARSLTQHIQYAMMAPNVAVIDTPGFYSSTDVAGHVAALRVAMENRPLSGIYLVVKYGRADDIAEVANTIMDVIGCDDIRIAITHEDVAANEEAFDRAELRRTLSATLDIDESKIFSFGKPTQASAVQAFIKRTLHEPIPFKMSREQQAMVASLGTGSRMLNKPINAILAKIVAAEVACREATGQGRGYNSDYLLTATQHATEEMVRTAKRDLFEAAANYSEEQQNIMYGKAGVMLSLRLKDFIETTNKLLSYDVTDMSIPNNIYKKCNFCGAVWVKTEGCDRITLCGNVPTAMSADIPTVDVEPEFVEVGGRWTVMFRFGGCKGFRARELFSWFHRQPVRWTQTFNKGAGTTHRKRADAIIESGCGASIFWRTMLPVSPSELGDMKKVEVLKESFPEESAKVRFENTVRSKELENKKILIDAINK